MEFKLGDRVILIRNGSLKGMLGKVVRDSSFSPHSIGVEFDNECSGHDCDGRGKYRHCWYIGASHLKIIYRGRE